MRSNENQKTRTRLGPNDVLKQNDTTIQHVRGAMNLVHWIIVKHELAERLRTENVQNIVRLSMHWKFQRMQNYVK